MGAERRPPGLVVEGRHVGPLDLAPDAGPVAPACTAASSTSGARRDRGSASSTARAAWRSPGFAFTASGLELHGDTGGAELDRLVLVSTADRLDVPLSTVGDTWRAHVPATGSRWGVPAVAATGALARRRRGTGRDRPRPPGAPLRRGGVAPRRRPRRPRPGGPAHQPRARARPGRRRRGPWRDRGAFNEKVARKVHYRVARRLPLTDTVFFEAWKGRQYSDSPRAVFEELVRRGDTRRAVWAVEDHGVEVPPTASRRSSPGAGRTTAPSVGRAGSSATTPCPSTTRSVRAPATDRPGRTPLKRIGFDIENLQMANKTTSSSSPRRSRSGTRWCPPNPYSTEIFRRAFRYDGPVLEIGYPRNDVFHRPEDGRRGRPRCAAGSASSPGSRSSSTRPRGGTTSTTGPVATSSR